MDRRPPDGDPVQKSVNVLAGAGADWLEIDEIITYGELVIL